jgi:hypothetical protein
MQPLGFAPLPEKDIQDMLNKHIPYRLSLIRDGYWPRWSTKNSQHTNQAFEAGAVSGRILLSFLGLKCGRKVVQLEPDQSHDSVDQKTTDDVKAPDIGGKFVEIDALPAADRHALAVFYRGVNKACAHFTFGSDHELSLDTYARAAPIIFRLMAERFPKNLGSWPKWSN